MWSYFGFPWECWERILLKLTARGVGRAAQRRPDNRPNVSVPSRLRCRKATGRRRPSGSGGSWEKTWLVCVSTRAESQGHAPYYCCWVGCSELIKERARALAAKGASSAQRAEVSARAWNRHLMELSEIPEQLTAGQTQAEFLQRYSQQGSCVLILCLAAWPPLLPPQSSQINSKQGQVGPPPPTLATP